MGNCQAIDAATLVIQHPSGKVERFYSPMSASHVMKINPGHYVAIFISTTLCPSNKDNGNCPNNKSENNNNQIRLTRIKLLKPTDTLCLGQVYRLVTTQEVMKGLKEKQKAKKRQSLSESVHKPDSEKSARNSNAEDTQLTKLERPRPRTNALSNNSGSVTTAKTRFWQPSLQSISETAS